MHIITLLRAWREIRKQERCLDMFLGPFFFSDFIPLPLHGSNSGRFSLSLSEHAVLLASIEEGLGAVVQRVQVFF